MTWLLKLPSTGCGHELTSRKALGWQPSSSHWLKQWLDTSSLTSGNVPLGQGQPQGTKGDHCKGGHRAPSVGTSAPGGAQEEPRRSSGPEHVSICCWGQMPWESLWPPRAHPDRQSFRLGDQHICQNGFLLLACNLAIKLRSHLQTTPCSWNAFQRLADLAGRMGSHIWIKVFTFFFQKFSRVLVTEEEGREAN